MLNIRKPAHSSVLPEVVEWIELTEFQLNTLRRYIHIYDDSKIKKKLTEPPTDIIGYYKYQGLRDYFIKVVAEEDHSALVLANKVSQWLFNNDVNVVCIEKDFPKALVGLDCWIYIYPFLEHRFRFRNIDEMYCIGKEIGQMHEVMSRFPETDVIFENCQQKNQILLAQFENFKHKNQSPLCAEATSLIHNFPLEELSLLDKNSQMIHGDLNMGNIIFSGDAKRPLIIDFEDSVSAYLNPLYDIAFIIQRFILSKDDRVELFIPLLLGYNQSYKIKIERGELFSMLKIISIRSLLILSTLKSSDMMDYKEEVLKFIDLYKNMLNNYSNISKIETLLLRNY